MDNDEAEVNGGKRKTSKDKRLLWQLLLIAPKFSTVSCQQTQTALRQ